MSHTPGPWGVFLAKLKGSGAVECFIQPEAAETEFGGIVAIIPSDTYPPEVRSANQRLLAAAPALLDAVVALATVKSHLFGDIDLEDFHPKVERAVGVIRAAMGDERFIQEFGQEAFDDRFGPNPTPHE